MSRKNMVIEAYRMTRIEDSWDNIVKYFKRGLVSVQELQNAEIIIMGNQAETELSAVTGDDVELFVYGVVSINERARYV